MLVNLFTGKMRSWAGEIAQLSGLDNATEVVRLFSSINLICIGSQDKADALQKLYETFMKGTYGGQRTGNPVIDTKIENLARLARITLDKNWEIRERRRSHKS